MLIKFDGHCARNISGVAKIKMNSLVLSVL